MRFTPLPGSFYLRPTLRVARELLGCVLVRRIGRAVLAGRIVEVEAYLGRRDPASHSYRGETARNSVMFRRGGCLYVYFTYGMHHCANVVTEGEGTGHAVLLRALEPLEGREVMARRRSRRAAADPHALTGGPARLCQAFGITLRENGADLRGKGLFIAGRPRGAPIPRIRRSPRIGVSAGREHRWRFWVEGSPWVSRPPSGRRQLPAEKLPRR